TGAAIWLPPAAPACWAGVPAIPGRRFVPQMISLSPPPLSEAGSALGPRARPDSGTGAGASGRGAAGAPLTARPLSFSYADSRLTRVSYFAPTGLRARMAVRSSGVIAPIRQRGGARTVRSPGDGP